MSETENTALVQQAYALFGRGDIAGLRGAQPSRPPRLEQSSLPP
jgi:hypothetical protein